MQRFSEFLGAVILLTFALLLSSCFGANVPEHREPLAKHVPAPQPKPPLAKPNDPRAKLAGFNHALAERLQHTRTALRPLETRAANLQRRFRSARAHKRSATVDPASVRSERNGVLQDALQLRTAAERSLLDLGALDRDYRNMRMLAGAARGMLDRDTERQMALNERIYKNIIDLLVHLIECPVNIIYDMMGSGATESTTEPPMAGTTEQPDYPLLPDDAAPNTLYDDDAEGGDGGGNGEPWLEEFHY